MADYVFVNGKILDGTKNMTVLEGSNVLVKDGKIVDIVPADSDIAGYEKIDLGGKYLMPGLINMHVHLAGNGKPQKKQRDNEKLVRSIMGSALTRAVAYKMVCGFAREELYSGVTTIRTVGGLGNFDTRLRDEIRNGKKIGPRILAANQGISVPGGHMAGSVAVAAHSAEEALAHLEQAEREHVESPQGVKVALENGVDSIEHGAKMDEEMIALFKEKGAFLCTTLSPALPYALFDRSITNATEVEQYNGNVVFEGIIACAKAALANDIPVVLGNDVGCPWITQYDFWRELYYFHKYVGVSNSFALYTATARSAELAGIGDATGTIEKGKCADMIVTSGNPLDDLRVLRHIDMVVAGGKILDQPKVKVKEQVAKELDRYIV